MGIHGDPVDYWMTFYLHLFHNMIFIFELVALLESIVVDAYCSCCSSRQKSTALCHVLVGRDVLVVELEDSELWPPARPPVSSPCICLSRASPC